MAMFLIAGGCRITGAQPDGDSIRFTPDDPAKWDLITGPNKVKRNASGAAQLRLDAIDALETHYDTPRTHQPLGLAHAAAAELQESITSASRMPLSLGPRAMADRSGRPPRPHSHHRCPVPRDKGIHT